MTLRIGYLVSGAFILLALYCSPVAGGQCFRQIAIGGEHCQRPKKNPDRFPRSEACCGTRNAVGFASELIAVEGRRKIYQCQLCGQESGPTTSGPGTTVAPSGWGQWSQWGQCSETCGQATRSRTRQCFGENCDAASDDMEIRDCIGLPLCAGWGQWSQWGQCSETCGQATRSRTRQCFGENCDASDDIEIRVCEIPLCAVNGQWGAWSQYTPCSVTCDAGTKHRRRQCDSPAPANGGRNCLGDDISYSGCNEVHCAIDGAWSEWSVWFPCSVTCGGGQQVRVRECDNPAPQHGGNECEGETWQGRGCNHDSCPVDGQWGYWSQYSSCSVTCDAGTKQRSRQCVNPAPAHGGSDCQGDKTSSMPCNDRPCAVDGAWSPWRPWSPCSVTCGIGTRSRDRSCDNPAPANGGRLCPGDNSQQEECQMIENCPIDGGFTEWTEWGVCRARPCSGQRGYRFSSRSCTQPRPQYGGQPCLGQDDRREVCYNNRHCGAKRVHGGWCSWQEWSACSPLSFRTRRRECGCPAPFNRGKDCPCPNVPDIICEVHGDDCQPGGSGSGDDGSGSGGGLVDQER